MDAEVDRAMVSQTDIESRAHKPYATGLRVLSGKVLYMVGLSAIGDRTSIRGHSPMTVKRSPPRSG